MKVAVIGCGSMGRVHASKYVNMPQVELVGVVDQHYESAQALAERCQTRAFASWEELVSEASPDAVSICLPTPLHKPYVLMAARSGVHAICEKPLAGTLADCQEMMDACKHGGVRLFVGHVIRFFPSYVDLKNKVEAGTIGRVGVAHARRAGMHPGSKGTWYSDDSATGGVIMDLLIHDIDFMRSILGEVETVYAMNRRTDQIDYSLVTLHFVSGAIANLEGFWGYPGEFHSNVELAGDKGILRYNSADTSSLQIVKEAADAGQARVHVKKNPGRFDPNYAELAHFIDCIIENKEPIITADDGYKAVEIALAAAQSIRTGMPVHLEHPAVQGNVK